MEKLESYCKEDFLLYFLNNYVTDPTDLNNRRCNDLYDFFLKKTDICIDSTEKMLSETNNQMIKHLLKMSLTGGPKFILLPYQFKNIDEDEKSLLVSNPSPFYFLTHHNLYNIEKFGIQISDLNNYLTEIGKISSEVLTLRVHPKQELNQFKSWEDITLFAPQRNSLVIADNYFLDNEQLYPYNIYKLLESFLPENLSFQDFNLTIITRQELLNPGRKYELINKYLISLNKPYETKFGIFLTATNKPHDRYLVSNYLRINVGHSFEIFNDKGNPKKETEITYIPINSGNSTMAHLLLLKTLAEYTKDAQCFGSRENRLLDYYR